MSCRIYHAMCLSHDMATLVTCQDPFACAKTRMKRLRRLMCVVAITLNQDLNVQAISTALVSALLQ